MLVEHRHIYHFYNFVALIIKSALVSFQYYKNFKSLKMQKVGRVFTHYGKSNTAIKYTFDAKSMLGILTLR